MILGISFLVLAVLGSTYAYYKYVIATINVDTITRGLDYYINYAKGTDITSGTLNPSKDYTGGNNITVTLNKKDNTYNIYGHILAVNIPLKTTTTTYTIYLWFDEASSNALSAENTSVSAKVRCEATMQEIDDEAYTAGIASRIKFMY